jgi:hypothetical protein
VKRTHSNVTDDLELEPVHRDISSKHDAHPHMLWRNMSFDLIVVRYALQRADGVAMSPLATTTVDPDAQ